MGTSTNAILAYGCDLGGEEDWKVREVDTFGGGLAVGWFDHEEDHFGTAVENQLLAAAGFTETDWEAHGYHERRRDALATFGVEVVSHCCGSCTEYILTAHERTAIRGYPETVDPVELAVVQGDVDARLSRALTALGLPPTQEAPVWLLASYWSS
ncbi:hypothetical protein [Nocardiopsis synnemataformans]|uniref:hypothetical protein n=1 Tax=Nocardiopsis synnemataformans TaxID=61305 RepID=UPI003EBD9BBF